MTRTPSTSDSDTTFASAGGAIDRGLAHDINNQLQGMVLHVDLLRPIVEGDAKAMKHLGYVQEGIERIMKLIEKPKE